MGAAGLDGALQKLELPALSGEVEILWDRWGIPHIFAQNPTDAYIALGYVMASERLWQIERARLVLARHEQHEEVLKGELSPGAGVAQQMPLLTPLDQKIVEALRRVDLDQLRPLDALNLLAELKKQLG